MFITPKPPSTRKKEAKNDDQVASSNNHPGGMISAQHISDETGKVRADIKPEQLLKIQVVKNPEDAYGSENYLVLEMTSLPEELVSRGFEKIEVVTRDIPEPENKKASPQEVSHFLGLRVWKQPDHPLHTVDLKQKVDNFRMEYLSSQGIIEDRTESAKLKPVVKKSKKKIASHFIRSNAAANPEELGFIDSTGKLEERLGGSASESLNSVEESASVSEHSILAQVRAVYSPDPPDKGQNSEKSRKLRPHPNIEKVLNAKEMNRANKRPFPGITSKEFMEGSVDPETEKSIIFHRKNKSRPKVKGVKVKRTPLKDKTKVKVQLPGLGKEISVVIRNEKTGELRRKVIAKKPDYRLPQSKVYFYEKDRDIPSLNISPLENNLVNIQVTRHQGARVDGVEIYRREVSDRLWQDEYELVQTVPFDQGEEIQTVTDVLGNERTYKYICLPVVNQTRLPVFGHRIIRSSNWKAQRPIEPLIYAYQQGIHVRISIRNLPYYANKILIYRNSTLDNEEILVDGKITSGRRSSMITFYDRPNAVEQEITYIVKAVDGNGIVHDFLDKPLVKFSATIGSEPAFVRSFYSSFSRENESVELSGVVSAVDAFTSQDDSVLSTPDTRTIRAAQQGVKIVRLSITRIDLLTGEEELLMEPVINPGLSDIKSEKAGGDKIRFKLQDNSTTAVENGYTPILSNRTYLYICRSAAYPLSVELRSVAGVETIPGIPARGRLPFDYDPFIFDHPSNTELGIMPARFSRMAKTNVMEVALTSSARSSQVFVPRFELDVKINISLRIRQDYRDKKVVELKFSIPDFLADDLDHIELLARVDSLSEQAVIDRMFIPNSSQFIYYDYQMLKQIGDKIFYQIKGIGLDFEQLFLSQESGISFPDDEDEV